MDGDAFPNVIDYWSQSELVYSRVPQVRWTPVNGNGRTVAVSMEFPGSAVDPGNVEVLFPELDSGASQPVAPTSPRTTAAAASGVIGRWRGS